MEIKHQPQHSWKGTFTSLLYWVQPVTLNCECSLTVSFRQHLQSDANIESLPHEEAIEIRFKPHVRNKSRWGRTLLWRVFYPHSETCRLFDLALHGSQVTSQPASFIYNVMCGGVDIIVIAAHPIRIWNWNHLDTFWNLSIFSVSLLYLTHNIYNVRFTVVLSFVNMILHNIIRPHIIFWSYIPLH